MNLLAVKVLVVVMIAELFPLILVAVMVILILLFSSRSLIVRLLVVPDRDLVPPGDCVPQFLSVAVYCTV